VLLVQTKASEGPGEAQSEEAKAKLHVAKRLAAKNENHGTCLEQLGEVMEGPTVSGVVIILIIVDLVCTGINDTLENTDLLNPAHKEQGEYTANLTHNICVSVLCIFLLEQCLHLLAFGREFFSHFWMVSDLIVVSVSLVCETVFEGKEEDWLSMLILLRMWKLVAFIFDMLLLEQERTERAEKLEKLAAHDTPMYGAAGSANGGPVVLAQA